MSDWTPPSCMVASPITCNPQLLPPVDATENATALQPTSLKRLAAEVLARNHACNQIATPAKTVMQLGYSEEGQKVASDSASVELAVASSQDNSKRTDAALRMALTQAAEGLPITLHDLIEAFGAEGAADWDEGYEPHCHPKFLRAFAEAVVQRLERDRVDSQKSLGAADSEAPKTSDPLDGLPLLREDRRLIEARTLHRRDRAAVLAEYARRWKEAAAAEPLDFRKANKGRLVANSWIRGATM